MDKWQRQAQERNRRTERWVWAVMAIVVVVIALIAFSSMGSPPVDDPPALENVPGGP